jgi:hypothetical protein
MFYWQLSRWGVLDFEGSQEIQENPEKFQENSKKSKKSPIKFLNQNLKLKVRPDETFLGLLLVEIIHMTSRIRCIFLVVIIRWSAHDVLQIGEFSGHVLFGPDQISCWIKFLVRIGGGFRWNQPGYDSAFLHESVYEERANLSVISVAFLVFQRHNVAGLVVDTLEWKMSEIRVLLEHQNLINKPHKTNCLLSAFQPIFSGS